MLEGFMDNKRSINTDDITNSLAGFKTLYEMRRGDFDELREWAETQCIKANDKVLEKVTYGIDKDIDLDL